MDKKSNKWWWPSLEFSKILCSPRLAEWRPGQNQLQTDPHGTPTHTGILNWQKELPSSFTCTFMMLQTPPRFVGANAGTRIFTSSHMSCIYHQSDHHHYCDHIHMCLPLWFCYHRSSSGIGQCPKENLFLKEVFPYHCIGITINKTIKDGGVATQCSYI